MDKISVVTVCFNSEKTIEDTIKSVVSQDYPNVEYIIIDGLSSDSTLEIIDRYRDKISKLLSEKDKGIYDAINKGVKLATGEVVAILNSDDLYADSKVLSRVMNLFLGSGAGAVYGDLEYVSREDVSRVSRYWRSGQYHEGRFLKGWMPPHPAFFLRRSCYESHGYFHTDFKTSADYELMLRMIHVKGVRPAYLPGVLVKMREGGQSNVSLKNRIEANREDHRAWMLNGIQPGRFTLLRKPLSKLNQFFRRR
jgi:glycosyltransferase involved in cell wall biosynthesis